MLLKDSTKKSRLQFVAEKIWHNDKYHFVGAALYTVLAFALGIYVHKTGFVSENLTPLVQENTRLIPKLIGGMLSSPEHITIDIKHNNFQKLAYQREQALAKGILIKSADDFVPAVIRYQDQAVKVDLRLKGDWTDHLEGDKWSFRIKVKGENTIWGMKQFSIQHPQTRNYLAEWFFHQALKHEGLIGLRYDFIKVILNGKDLGVYALEEHFEKRLIEHNRLREGPIVKFNEDLWWAEQAQQNSNFPNALGNGCGLYLSSNIDGFQTKKWLADSASYALFAKAVHLLEAFRRGELKTSAVFDVPKLAKYFAIVDLMGAHHAALWHNTRFYYNPITSRLEPIGFDADCGHPTESLCATDQGVYIGKSGSKDNNDFWAMIFDDEIFFQEYIKTLERIAEPSYLDAFFAERREETEKNLNIIYGEFPDYDFSKEVLYRNQQYIKTVLNPVKGLQAFYGRVQGNRLDLELGNIHMMPVEILNVSYKDSLWFAPTGKNILPAKFYKELMDYRLVNFTLPAGWAWSDTMIAHLKVNYKILGASRTGAETVFPWRSFDDGFVKEDFIRQPPNADRFEFLATDEFNKKIIIKPGAWNLNQNLIIPGGYQVACGEGTRLNLSRSAMILSYSPLQFFGTEENPIVIHSADSTGQAVVVMNAGQKSVLEYVTFDNLSNPSQNGWELTGAVYFYESPVDISHCQFVNNRSEDGLNIVRSDFSIDQTLFSHTSSDAFDADFCKGKITNTSFVNCGNDGIDVSGSLVELRNIFIDGAGDKGVSAGENSQATAEQIKIKNAALAVAGKDMTAMKIHDISIAGGEIGFTVYQKKPEYGRASITATAVSIEKTSIPYLVEEQSLLSVDGKMIEPSRKNVKAILYGVEYGKASR